MISFKRATEVTVAAILFAGLGGAVFAQDAISQRIALMKGMGADIAAVRAGATATPADMAAAKTAATKLSSDMKKFGTLFPKGSDASAGKTRAKAEIWSDAAGWKAANDKANAAAGAVVAAAGGKDGAAVVTALTAFQQNCTSCHTAYRGPAAP